MPSKKKTPVKKRSLARKPAKKAAAFPKPEPKLSDEVIPAPDPAPKPEPSLAAFEHIVRQDFADMAVIPKKDLTNLLTLLGEATFDMKFGDPFSQVTEAQSHITQVSQWVTGVKSRL